MKRTDLRTAQSTPLVSLELLIEPRLLMFEKLQNIGKIYKQCLSRNFKNKNKGCRASQHLSYFSPENHWITHMGVSWKLLELPLSKTYQRKYTTKFLIQFLIHENPLVQNFSIFVKHFKKCSEYSTDESMYGTCWLNSPCTWLFISVFVYVRRCVGFYILIKDNLYHVLISQHWYQDGGIRKCEDPTVFRQSWDESIHYMEKRNWNMAQS